MTGRIARRTSNGEGDKITTVPYLTQASILTGFLIRNLPVDNRIRVKTRLVLIVSSEYFQLQSQLTSARQFVLPYLYLEYLACTCMHVPPQYPVFIQRHKFNNIGT
jgi:hypothetical protein